LETEKVLYEELTPAEFRLRLRRTPIAFLPLGTLEYHGEHLPFGVDGIVPREFFVQLARRVGGIVLPMLFMGPDKTYADWQGQELRVRQAQRGPVFDPEAQTRRESIEGPLYGMECYWRLPKESWGKLDGNCYWQLDAHFQRQVCDVLKGLQRVGFKIVVAHGHAPSRRMFAKLAPEWEKHFGLRLFTCDRPEAEGPGLLTDHGAANETSLMMALRPDLIAEEVLIEGAACPLRGVWGQNPREFASADGGRWIMEQDLGRMQGILQNALAEIAGKTDGT
jgi:creatinine amidohydrolase